MDAAKGNCTAVLQLFQGIALAMVSKIYRSEQSNFIIKTHTAIMRIRGIEVGIRLLPNSSTFLNFSGRTTVSSIFPRAQGTVELLNNQGTSVERSLPPTLAFELKDEDREQFMRQLATGLITRHRGKESGLDKSESEGLATKPVAGDHVPFAIDPRVVTHGIDPRVIAPSMLFITPVTPAQVTKSDEVVSPKGILPGSGVGSSPPAGKLPVTPAKPR